MSRDATAGSHTVGTEIDLDHHATTPCDPRVVEAMLPYFGGAYGNPASDHARGHRAHDAVETARGEVAALIGCAPTEIVFTSGATEADNLALIGVAEALAARGRHIVTAATEHKAVLDSCAALEARGFDVTYLPVAADGRVSGDAVDAVLRDDTILVSLMRANNEIGVLHPIEAIAARCKARGVLLHTDAAQALAYLDCDVRRLDVDLMSLSAHKAYGPPGVGALYVRRRRPRVRLQPQLHGGGHERGRRSGTLPVPSIVGFGRACALIAEQRRDDALRLAALRDDLLRRLRQAFDEVVVHGSLRHRLPNNLNVSLPRLARAGVTSAQVLARLDTVAASTGSACTSSNVDGSYVLKALPGAGSLAESAFRFGLGRGTTERQIVTATARLVDAVDATIAAGPGVDPAEACLSACEVAE